MAMSSSGLVLPTWQTSLNGTQTVLNLVAATNLIALFNNTITNNLSTDTSYAVAPYNANEVTGTNWAAGGVALTSQTITESPTSVLMWDAADVSVANATFTGARGGLIYANANTPKNGICLVNFGADYSPVAGTFTISWAATGIATIDLF
jgi:hypothetical protein